MKLILNCQTYFLLLQTIALPTDELGNMVMTLNWHLAIPRSLQVRKTAREP